MNINRNNMSFLMNRLFSQMNRNKDGISSRANSNINAGVKYKHSYLYYDENGVPFHSKEEADRCIKGTNGNWKKIVSVSDEAKAELAEVVKQDFISTNGMGKPEGSKKPDVINIEVILDAVCGAMAEGLEERKVEKIDTPEEKEEGEASSAGKRRRVRRNEERAAAPAEAEATEEVKEETEEA